MISSHQHTQHPERKDENKFFKLNIRYSGAPPPTRAQQQQQQQQVITQQQQQQFRIGPTSGEDTSSLDHVDCVSSLPVDTTTVGDILDCVYRNHPLFAYYASNNKDPRKAAHSKIRLIFAGRILDPINEPHRRFIDIVRETSGDVDDFLTIHMLATGITATATATATAATASPLQQHQKDEQKQQSTNTSTSREDFSSNDLQGRIDAQENGVQLSTLQPPPQQQHEEASSSSVPLSFATQHQQQFVLQQPILGLGSPLLFPSHQDQQLLMIQQSLIQQQHLIIQSLRDALQTLVTATAAPAQGTASSSVHVPLGPSVHAPPQGVQQQQQQDARVQAEGVNNNNYNFYNVAQNAAVPQQQQQQQQAQPQPQREEEEVRPQRLLDDNNARGAAPRQQENVLYAMAKVLFKIALMCYLLGSHQGTFKWVMMTFSFFMIYVGYKLLSVVSNLYTQRREQWQRQNQHNNRASARSRKRRPRNPVLRFFYVASHVLALFFISLNPNYNPVPLPADDEAEEEGEQEQEQQPQARPDHQAAEDIQRRQEDVAQEHVAHVE